MNNGMSNSKSARLIFWFLWLSGLFMGLIMIGRLMVFIVADNNLQKAVPYFLGFIWQCGVQIFALRRYQYSMSFLEPLVIQIGGSLALFFLIASVFVLGK